MAMAVHKAQMNDRWRLIRFLLATMVLGAAFLGIKFYEYYHKFEEGLIPGAGLQWEGEYANQASLFSC